MFEKYYRQLSADNKLKNYNINSNFDSLDGPKSQANKAGINLMIFILIFVENCLYWGAMHDF